MYVCVLEPSGPRELQLKPIAILFFAVGRPVATEEVPDELNFSSTNRSGRLIKMRSGGGGVVVVVVVVMVGGGGGG